MKKQSGRIVVDSVVVGFALFSMFFGAGNVVFPPYLGLQSGSEWIVGFASYFLADIGLAMLTIFSILHCGSPDQITRHIGRVPGDVLMCAIILCVGPIVAIPRTAATTFEMSIAPLTDLISPFVFSIAFFALVFFLSIRESAVVDIVGKVLTPLLLVGLFVLIAKGILTPLGPVSACINPNGTIITGIKSGYQTLDVFGALAFGIIILKSADEKGYTENRSRLKMVGLSVFISGTLLMLVYCGLTYLGACSGTIFPAEIGRAELITGIVDRLLGTAGTVIFGIVVALACLTTAIALLSSSASYFSKLSHGKISYRILVSVICIFGTVISNLGLDRMVAIASPILDIIYPPTLVLVILTLSDRKIGRSVFVFSVAGALLCSVLNALNTYVLSIPFINRLPLTSIGLSWVIPAALCGLAAALIEHLTSQKNT